MATAVDVSNEGGTLCCIICQKSSSDVTLSSCFHTFCPDCLDGHGRSEQKLGRYKCPICHVAIDVPAEYKLSRPLSNMITSREDNPIYCTVCGPKIPAINACLQCNENFCANCTSAHLKMKVSRYHSHRVQPVSPPSDLRDTQTTCPRHQNEEIIVLCKECNVFLCQLCKMIEHEGHVTRLVSDEANDIRQELTSLIQQQIGIAENLQIRMARIQNQSQQYPNVLEHELQKVRHQSSLLHLEIDRQATEKEKELVEHFDCVEGQDAESYQRLQKEYESYISMTKEAQDIIYSEDDLKAALRGRSLQEQLTRYDIQSPSSFHSTVVPAKYFVAGPIDGLHLRTMVGRLEGGLPPKQLMEGSHQQEIFKNTSRVASISELKDTGRHYACRPVSVQDVSVFDLPYSDSVGYIYGIAPISKTGKAWVSMLDCSSVTLVDKEGYIFRSVNVGEFCDSVTHDGKGGCFVTCQKSKSVKHVKADGTAETVLERLEQVPFGIAYLQMENEIGELFVCFMEPNSRLTAYNGQRGAVRAFTETGQDLSRKFHVQAPVRIGLDSANGLVCVSDHTNGCVLVCEKTGGAVKTLYCGEDGRQENFKPLGVCFDNTGCVVVTDWNNSKVSRLSRDGEHVQTIVGDVDGPQSVAVDEENNLWLGCRNGRIQILKLC